MVTPKPSAWSWSSALLGPSPALVVQHRSLLLVLGSATGQQMIDNRQERAGHRHRRPARPRRAALRWYCRANVLPFSLAAACAAGIGMVRNQRAPLRVLPPLRWPAVSLLPGAKPAPAVR